MANYILAIIIILIIGAAFAYIMKKNGAKNVLAVRIQEAVLLKEIV